MKPLVGAVKLHVAVEITHPKDGVHYEVIYSFYFWCFFNSFIEL